MNERLQAADRIGRLDRRDLAHQAVAQDAATGGFTDICIQAIHKIGALGVRDATAATCARRFADERRFAEARQVAERIQSRNRRDEVLGEIAAGGR